MEFLIMKKGCLLWATILLLLSVTGCTVPFKGLPREDLLDRPAMYAAVPPDGNLAAAADDRVYDTLLYSRKLNGGLNGQVVGNDKFVVVPSFNERVYLLRTETGKEISSFRTESFLGSAAALVGELMYYVEERGGDRLTCLNLTNGKVVFTRKIIDSPGAPVVDGENVYVASKEGRLFKLSRWTGDSVWAYAGQEQSYVSPTVDAAQVYIGTDRGNVVCLDKATGKRRWSFKAGGAIFARPLAGEYLYCPSGDGILYVLDRATGTLIWSFTAGAAIQTTPAIHQGKLFFGADDWTVYCLDAISGRQLWSFETDGVVQSSPLVTPTSLFVCNAAGGIYQLSHEGDLLKSTRVKGSITAAPSIIGDRLFVVTRSRMLYCFGSATTPAN